MSSAKRSPAAPTNRAAQISTNQPIQNTASPFEKLRRCLRGERQTGRDQYMFFSPTRNERTQSVAVKVLPDGRLLVHDFGGDETADILAAVGLSLGDLFPDHGRNHGRPVPPGQCWDFRALLRQLRFESTVVICAANDLVHGQEITPTDKARLTQAAIRIARVAEVAK